MVIPLALGEGLSLPLALVIPLPLSIGDEVSVTPNVIHNVFIVFGAISCELWHPPRMRTLVIAATPRAPGPQGGTLSY